MDVTVQSVRATIDTAKPLSIGVRSSRALVANRQLGEVTQLRTQREQQITADLTRGYSRTAYNRDNRAIAAAFNT